MVDVITAMTIFSSNTPMQKLSRSNGLGALPDAIEPLVTYEESGAMNLEFKYPSSGTNFDKIGRRNIIMAKPTRYMNPFPFRIYEITKEINGLVTVRAEDITHDLSGYTVSPFTMVPEEGAVDDILGREWKETGYVYIDEYLDYVLAYCDISPEQMKYTISINPEELANVKDIFTFKIQADANGEVSITKPLTLRSLLGTDESVGLIGLFGGFWSYSIDYSTGFIMMTLWSTRGLDRGVQIRYGKNMTGMNYTESTTGQYTGIYPYWYKSSEGLMDLITDEPSPETSARGMYKYSDKNGKFRYCVDAYDDDQFADYEILYNYILPVDLTGKFQQCPSSDELWEEATKYIRDNNIGFPAESLTVSFIDLSQSSEFKDYAFLEEVRLGDIVTVYHPEMRVSASMSVNKMVYNVATNKYKSIDIGKPVIFIGDTIAELGMQTVTNEDAIKKTKIQKSYVKDNVVKEWTGMSEIDILIPAYDGRDSDSFGPMRSKYKYAKSIRFSDITVKPYMYAYLTINPRTDPKPVGQRSYYNNYIDLCKKTMIKGNYIWFFYNYTEQGQQHTSGEFPICLDRVEIYHYE